MTTHGHSWPRITTHHHSSCRIWQARHRRAVQALWQKLLAVGDIYLGAYEGWYSIRDECFYTEDELVEDDSGARVAPTGARPMAPRWDPYDTVWDSTYGTPMTPYDTL